MILRRSDYDQAARYLQHVCGLMDSQAPGTMRATRMFCGSQSAGSRLAITLWGTPRLK
jgi:hypothetical protein